MILGILTDTAIAQKLFWKPWNSHTQSVWYIKKLKTKEGTGAGFFGPKLKQPCVQEK